jgi:hypothetical protein
MLVPAYAATIHKSQGSEYPAVIIPVLTQHYPMLQRNLLYTGVTRGKRLVVLVGQKKAIAIEVPPSGRGGGPNLRNGSAPRYLRHQPSSAGSCTKRLIEELPTGVGDTADDSCALRNQRFGLRSRPVIDDHFVTGLQQARSHAAAHVPQSDKSDFHDECSCPVDCFTR